MSRGKIVLMPLDERPCNHDYPRMMPKADFELVLPPKHLMGQKKTPAPTQAIAQWLLEQVDTADAMILSLDMLIYGGIVPSRLHHESQQELLRRASLVRQLRSRNPRMKLYVFGLIMRCPTYSSGDEEPDYYETCGAQIHQYGRYAHLDRLGKLSPQDRAAFAAVKSAIDPAVLEDYTTRRQTNLSVLMHCLSYAADHTVDYFIVPQDDAAVYGFTSMDQITVRQYLKTNLLHCKTAMYPSADDVGMTLLARAAAEFYDVRPRVYVHYASTKGASVIPLFEDRAVGETIKYHILAVGGIQVYSLAEADLLLAVNVGSRMLEVGDPDRVMAYDVERNLAEFINYIEYALDSGKDVAVADIAWANRADTELTGLMAQRGLLLRIQAYAGWNTSSNTIGTALCQGILHSLGGDEAGNRSFLLHRYFEDIGFMAYARGFVTENYLPSLELSYDQTDGPGGKAAELVRETVLAYMQENYGALASLVQDVSVRMPWSRMFETDIKLQLKSCKGAKK